MVEDRKRGDNVEGVKPQEMHSHSDAHLDIVAQAWGPKASDTRTPLQKSSTELELKHISWLNLRLTKIATGKPDGSMILLMPKDINRQMI